MITVEFKLEKATKNAVRFTEVLPDNFASPKIGTLYVQKSTLGAMGWHEGQNLKVTLEMVK